MTWALLITLVLVLGIALVALIAQRAELRRTHEGLEERSRARERGSHAARLQYPVPDLAKCIGCGTCVAACPEEGVLQVIHGQAVVVHGARCVGHGVCAKECPVGAIALTFGDLTERRDLPALTPDFEAVGSPGLYLAGEVTGFSLIRTAITHGVAVARAASERVRSSDVTPTSDVLDLAIVGAGPAGLACALEAKRLGLRAVILEQERLGGTVTSYPRRKLVITQPVELPLHGKLTRTTYSKEELLELWEEVVREHEIEILTQCNFTGLDRSPDGNFLVYSSRGTLEARNVCIAIGRRGTPRKLGVRGEESSKVAYSLMDAQSYTNRRILVVGGGDSAIEAALGLAEQTGNQVTLSYRRAHFNRLKLRNEERVHEAIRAGHLECLFESQVRSIESGEVELELGVGDTLQVVRIPNDDVFVFAGGLAPFPLLESCGVSFDPADRPPAEALSDRGNSLVKVLGAALILALAVLGWIVAYGSYYDLSPAQRLGAEAHDLLRPGGGLGLAFGIVGASLIAINLAYLPRRSPSIRFQLGSLQHWMSAHVLSGILALVAVIAHSALQPKHTVGGHALAGLAFLVATGAIGRYFYSFVPHAANGRELQIDEVRARLAGLTAEWDREKSHFGDRVRREIDRLVQSGQWKSGLFQRVLLLVTGERRLRRTLRRIERDAVQEGLAGDQVSELLVLARRAYREALVAAHFEDLRSLIASWRYFHRWVALLMVALVVIHIVTALQYGSAFEGGN
ncbi:MAG: NAD(P)-binding domain-containing protein [Planctomycetes bacterium]|nr:NAD(P)-binding domain-containing protein [Planctomycetota bacterium]